MLTRHVSTLNNSMTKATLIHNPGAGDEEHAKENLLKVINNEGFECRYSSTKKAGWDDIDDENEILIVAGGDGTVRKLTKVLMQRKKLQKMFPIGLLPLGTANNISKTLKIEGETLSIIKSWKENKMKHFDIGLSDIDKDTFFLESFGYGLFPNLMKQMGRIDELLLNTPEKKLAKALEVLLDITKTYEAKNCFLHIDGANHSGKFLLVEVMNTNSIGPNLVLSPNGNPGDGVLEIVLITDDDRQKFTDYVQALIKGEEQRYDFTTIKGKNIEISWDGRNVHLDDELLKLKEHQKVNIEIKSGVLEFLIP